MTEYDFELDGHMFCKETDADAKLKNIGTCPNCNPEFVEHMGKLSRYWEVRKSSPFRLTHTKLYISELTVLDNTIKNSFDTPKEQFQMLQEELLTKSEDAMFEHFKLEEPDIPDEVIRAFIRMYIGFELIMERDHQKLQNVYKVIPSWKPFDMIDFDCEEAKVIEDYLLPK